MKRPPLVCRAALVAALLVLANAPADAQGPATKPPPPVTKAPPRLPPNASQSAQIPAGVDTGSPGTSQAVPLGTPVPPVPGADRNELKTRSAAARAAARPKLAASAADCVRRIDSAAAAEAASSSPPPAKAAPEGTGGAPSGAAGPAAARAVAPC